MTRLDNLRLAPHNRRMASRRAAISMDRFESAMAAIAPLELAEEWDRVGVLLAGDRRSLRRVLLTIDLTEAVLAEAIALDADGIVAYHPPIFDPIARLDDRTAKSRTIRAAARAGLFIHSPHTALDAAEGGVNDWIAGGLGQGRIRPLVPASQSRPSEAFKIVTFLPEKAAEPVREALAGAGAGRIGEYTHCSFSSAGSGTFLGGEASRPAVGTGGRLERVAELRLEMVCSASRLADAVAALRSTHPYEEPPIEIHPLSPLPDRRVGGGRVLVLDKPVTLAAIGSRLRRHLGVKRVAVASPAGGRRVSRVAVVAGSGGSLLAAVLAEGCEAFITGELSHHPVLEAVAAGCGVLLAGHTNTERPYLAVLAKRLRQALPGLEVRTSRTDRDPFSSR